MDHSWLGFGYQNTSAGVAVNQMTLLHESTCLACIQILASDVAKLPVRMYRLLAGGDKELAKDHPVYRMLKDPNDWMTKYEFIEHQMVNLLLWGNSYAVILRDPGGTPVELVPVNSSQVTIYESPVDREYFYFVARNSLHETAVLKDVPQRVPSEDVLHVKWMTYINSLWGTDRADLMRDTIGLSLALEQSAARLVGNGARPSSVIELEQILSKEALERAVTSWQQTQGGPARNGGTAFLGPGMRYKPISWSSVDQQFMEQREFVIAQLARSFRIPLYKLSLTESQPGSSLLQLETDYANSTLASWCDRITARLYKTFDIDPEEYSIEFEYQHALKADLQTQINALRVGVLGGLYSPNEARAALGLPSVQNGDLILQPANVVPLGTMPQMGGSGPGSDSTGKPADGGDGSGVDPLVNPDDMPPTM